ncbi:UNVERIFIED_CONTAM: hypothetical protein Slati_3739400 [Sesamum latifolium]|uniref:Reverse transcriptase zinc-binding domain-containing protein n=1 Tax=Sesamum latifolium TaxID=2727402 RepID=A0AAW2U4B5_9LAMI
MESIEITHSLPIIHGGMDRILWTGPGGSFSSAAAYDMLHPPGPKVDWSSLLVGTFKIPRHRFILWLAILGRLSTLDKPWLHHLGTDCVLCRADTPETHDHLFFTCSFASECLHEIRGVVSFHWPYSSWTTAIRWASARWRGSMWSMLRTGHYWPHLCIIFGMSGIAVFFSKLRGPLWILLGLLFLRLGI